jgi:hypothetical protein
MNICIYNYYDEFNHDNNIFCPEQYGLVEGGEKPLLALKKRLENIGHSLSTIDKYPINQFQKYIFLDYPTHNISLLEKLSQLKIDLYLVIFESEIIKPDNWNNDNYHYFKKIFGWKDLKLPRYERLMIPQNMDPFQSDISFSKRKLACLVASNKYSYDSRELYSERRKIIRWFEKYYPNDFYLYGKGWGDGERVSIPRIINKIYPNMKPLLHSYPSYQGEVVSKRRIIGEFRFNFCLENVQAIEGYITEKIFDALLSGTVPIYLGAADISNFIPRTAFIYYSDFKNLKELYKYISNMDEVEWNNYIDNARIFLNNDEINIFSPEYFSNRITAEILR